MLELTNYWLVIGILCVVTNGKLAFARFGEKVDERKSSGNSGQTFHMNKYLGNEAKHNDRSKNNTKEHSHFAFASYYGDHMVLQRAPMQSSVWGYASSTNLTSKVVVTLTDSVQTVASYTVHVHRGAAGMTVWSVQLDARKAGGPYTLTAELGAEKIQLRDILFGEVWLCSGQSNMAFTVPMMYQAKSEEELADKLPLIRLFTSSQETSDVPLYDLKGVMQQWSVASSASVGHNNWGYFSAVCWVYGRYLHKVLDVPIGLITTSWGGTPIETWSSPSVLSKCGIKSEASVDHQMDPPQMDPSQMVPPQMDPTQMMDDIEAPPQQHSVLFNAMIYPFFNLTIRGAIWYQGEANSHAPDTYNCTFPGMIADWRTRWSLATNKQTPDNFPFGFVQLGPNTKYEEGKSIIRGYADIRWHQTADMGFVPNSRLPNVFMGTAVDLTDDNSPFGPVHIRDKETVGQRLVLSGLAVAYNKSDLNFQGPTVSAYFIDIGFYNLTLEFDNRKSEIIVRNIDGFEVCCNHDNQTTCPMDSDTWTAAPIIGSDKYSVTLSWKPCAGQFIMGVRYLWRETPCTYKKCAVYRYDMASLPAPPFVVQALIGGGQNIK